MSALQFDATTVNPAGDRGPVPEGEYNVILQNSDVKATANGRMMNCTFKILDGPIAGQMIFQNINFAHSNPVAQQIGQERLSALCHCVGILKISDTQQLHGRPLKLKVGVQEGGDGKKYNEILAFLKADGTAPTSNGASATAPAWANAATPTPAPATSPSPTPTPAPAVAPTLPMYNVAHNGAVVPGGPFTVDQIRTNPAGLAALFVCPVGGTAWEPGTSLAVPVTQAAPTLPPTPTEPAIPSGTLPPWLQNKT